MGSEADLEPVPGGVYRVRMADGFSAAGRFVEVAFPHLVVFTWGFADDEAASRTKRARVARVASRAAPVPCRAAVPGSR